MPVRRIVILFCSAVLFASEPSVVWQGDTANLTWTETLKDTTATAGQVPFTILTGPFISWLTDTSAAVTWEVVGIKNYNTALTTSKPTLFRTVTIAGLSQDRVYQYRLSSTGTTYTYTGTTYAFRTLPSKTNPDLDFAVLGDAQYIGNLAVTRNYQQLSAWRPPLLLYAGDITCGVTDHDDCYKMFNYSRLCRAQTLMATTLGNHDISETRIGYDWSKDYFPYPAPSNAAGPSKPPYYYSFDAGNVHVTVLCSIFDTLTKDTTFRNRMVYDSFTYRQQLSWAEEDLKNTDRKWKIVMAHYPTAWSGAAPFFQDYRPLFDRYGVQLYFAGHLHIYRRYARLDPVLKTAADSGWVEVTSGGGSSLATYKCGTTFNYPVLQCSNVRHYLQVRVRGDTINFTAIDTTGAIVERWSLPYLGQPFTTTSLESESAPTPAMTGLNLLSLGQNKIAAEWNQPNSAGFTLSVFDCNGRLLNRIKGNGKEGKNRHVITLPGRSTGLCFFRMKSEKLSLTGKTPILP